eukprot:scaffold9039_cov115-Isochrysis_galbana.AAC.2
MVSAMGVSHVGDECPWTAGAVIVKGGAATPEGVFAAHTPRAKSGQLWPVAQARASSARLCAGPGQEVPQALARARNRTCVEPLSALLGWARSEPGSSSVSAPVGSKMS